MTIIYLTLNYFSYTFADYNNIDNLNFQIYVIVAKSISILMQYNSFNLWYSLNILQREEKEKSKQILILSKVLPIRKL